MIFITVGTSPFPFSRMAKIAKFLSQKFPSEKIVFQRGSTQVRIKSSLTTYYQWLPYQRVQYYIKCSRIVVCHATPSTVFQCLKIGKIPYILPRLRKFGEQVDDHQYHFANFAASKRMAILISHHTGFEPTTCPPRPMRPHPHLISYLQSISHV